ncbi:MAG: nuclear transport factor 2 family protein [Pseudonocardia sp.]|nr:nuclear transport factor 2 family protein [Pseudonocardia sp.]
MATDAENLTAAFAAADKGDADPLVELFHDDMTWAGFALDGTQKVYSKGEFLEAFGVLAKVDEFANEVVRTETTPEGVVIAWVRIYRKLGEHVIDVTMITTHQFVDGRAVRSTDTCPPEFAEFWKTVGLSA